MIERVIFQVLKDGIAEIQADLTILERHFQKTLCLAEAEINTIKAVFADTPPNIIHHYAREGDQIPLWAIVLQEESESERFIGNDVGMIGELTLGGDDDPDFDPDDPASGEEAQGSIYQSTYGVMTYTEHPDVTRYYYELSKLILGRARPSLHGVAGILDLQFSGGDLAPDPRYIPAHLFVRQLVIGVQRLECLAAGTTAQRAFRIEGIHLDDGASSASKGGVRTGVRLMGETDD